MRKFLQVFCIVLSFFIIQEKSISQQVIEGLVGGNILGLYQFENKLYVTSQGYIFTSSDEGKSWSKYNINDNGYQFGKIYFNGNDVYAGTDYGLIFHSSDKGKTWEQYNTKSLDSASVTGFVKNGKSLIISTRKGIFKTENGEFWTPLKNGLNTQDIYNIIDMNNILFVATFGGGIYKSTDNGENWISCSNGITSPFVFDIKHSDNILYANSYDGTFTSVDSGKTFNKFVLASTSAPIYAMDISGNDQIFSSGDTTYISVDKGKTWKTSTNNGINTKIITGYIKMGNNYYCATSFGMYKSTDQGANWFEINKGLTNLMVRFASDGKNLFALSGPRLFLSLDKGVTWKIIYNGDFQVSLDLFFFDNELYLFSIANGGSTLYKSKDNGNTWQILNKQFKNEIPTDLIKVKNKFLLATSGNGIYVSNDSCKTFTAIKGNILESASLYQIISVDGVLLSASYDFGISRSTDDGITWEDSNNGYPSKKCSNLKYDGKNVYAFTYFKNKGVYRSNDKGLSWKECVNGLPDLLTRDLAIKGDTIFVATLGDGVYFSTNSGDSWNKYMSSKSILSAYLLVFNNKLYIGTWGDGGYGVDIFTGVNEDYFSAFPLYPNPVINTFNVSEELVGKDYEIINSLGIIIFKGKYLNGIDVSSLTSGMYYIKIGDKLNKFIKN
jgi:photosystem II stability/assembly factor-like uncharacterized protein